MYPLGGVVAVLISVMLVTAGAPENEASSVFHVVGSSATSETNFAYRILLPALPIVQVKDWVVATGVPVQEELSYTPSKVKPSFGTAVQGVDCVGPKYAQLFSALDVGVCPE